MKAAISQLALLIGLLVLFFLALPIWSYAKSLGWGYAPSIVIAVAIIVAALLMISETPRRKLF